jgi:hypothetical protein
MKRILLIFTIVVFVILVWQLYPTEKKRLRHDINTLRKTFESKNVTEVMDYIDPSYQDLSGLKCDELARAIEQFFMQVDSIRVQMSGMKLSIDSIAEENIVFASCSLGIKVLARYEGERVLAFGGIVHPSSVWAWFRKSDGKYRVYYARY